MANDRRSLPGVTTLHSEIMMPEETQTMQSLYTAFANNSSLLDKEVSEAMNGLDELAVEVIATTTKIITKLGELTVCGRGTYRRETGEKDSFHVLVDGGLRRMWNTSGKILVDTDDDVVLGWDLRAFMKAAQDVEAALNAAQGYDDQLEAIGKAVAMAEDKEKIKELNQIATILAVGS